MVAFWYQLTQVVLLKQVCVVNILQCTVPNFVVWVNYTVHLKHD